ncbi:M15 family metallopeptidase [Alkalihalobacillus sp. LMS6]|uniref:M15 family metallopeptidase n=1 Tax=Alkalihalobacillus sp. LMS6 TaxID=2924034 RepID=UPI0026F09942|nr:M15 family metallopeptidase [Alkalihalobacillus sp. LMS6]
MRQFKKSFLLIFTCLLTLGFIISYYALMNDRFSFTIDHSEGTLADNYVVQEPEVPIEEVIYAEELHPKVADKTETLIEQAADNGIDIIITDGFRSFEEQDELYQQGRSSSGNIVTNVSGGESFHNFGLAVDYALLNSDGQPIWDIEYDGNQNGESDWFEVADMAKDLGFVWGGDWNHFVDYPHLEMTFGYSIRDIQRALEQSEHQNEVTTQ